MVISSVPAKLCQMSVLLRNKSRAYPQVLTLNAKLDSTVNNMLSDILSVEIAVILQSMHQGLKIIVIIIIISYAVKHYHYIISLC